MCELKAIVRWLVVCFLLVMVKFIRVLSVVEVGIAVIFGGVGAVVGLRRRQLFTGFAE